MKKHLETFTGELQTYNLNNIEVMFFNSIYNKTFMSLTQSDKTKPSGFQKPVMIDVTNLSSKIILKKITLIIEEQELSLRNTSETLNILYKTINRRYNNDKATQTSNTIKSFKL